MMDWGCPTHFQCLRRLEKVVLGAICIDGVLKLWDCVLCEKLGYSTKLWSPPASSQNLSFVSMCKMENFFPPRFSLMPSSKYLKTLVKISQPYSKTDFLV